MNGELPPDPEEHVIRSALEWREEQKRRSKGPDPEEPKAKPNGHAQPLDMEPLSVLADRPVPQRMFMDSAHLLPLRNVTLLGGDGGTGKSLLAMQLHLACNTAMPWLGLDIAQGPSLYMSAEDDRDEIHTRAAEICEAEGISLGEAFQANMIYRAGKDAVMAVEKNGVLVPTPFYSQMEASLEAVAPQLLILDNQADIFSGNENNRTLAKHFIGMLRGLCIRFDCIVLLLGHPSLSGMASGSGMSGSTAWSNSVRSRLYLKRPDGASVEGDDDNARILEVMKANYGPIGQRIELKYSNGRFVRTEHKNPWDRVAVADVELVKEAFGSGTWRFNEQAAHWGGYAVADLLGWDVGQGIGAPARNREQNRNRTHVRTFLHGWVKAGSIFIVNGFDAKREPAQFYSNKEA